VRREVAVLASNAEFAVVTLLDEKRVVIAATRRAWFGRPVQDVLPAFDIIQADKAVKRRRALVVMGPRQRSLFGYTGIPVGGEGEDLLPSRIGNLFVAYDLSRSKAEARAQILNQSLYWTGW
jgi:hypothetical protein